MSDHQPGDIISSAKGLEKEESLILKPMPTTLTDTVALLKAIDVLRAKHPESKAEIDNIKGGVIRLATFLTNARLIINKSLQMAVVKKPTQRTPQQGD